MSAIVNPRNLAAALQWNLQRAMQAKPELVIGHVGQVSKIIDQIAAALPTNSPANRTISQLRVSVNGHNFKWAQDDVKRLIAKL